MRPHCNEVWSAEPALLMVRAWLVTGSLLSELGASLVEPAKVRWAISSNAS